MLSWTPRRIWLVGEQPEPAFDLVEPGGAGRGEVQMEPWVGGEPGADRRGLVGGQVVADQMHVQFGGHVLVDLGRGTCLNSAARCRRWMLWMTSPVATSSAANRSVVPARA